MNATLRALSVLVAAQAVFLLGWAGYHETIRQRAPVIRLECRPVDPQDLLRGDYLTLRYDISQTNAGPQKLTYGESVWVVLQPKDGHYVLGQVSREQPPVKAGEFLVRGTIGSRWMRQQAENNLVINYGIERYFVPEGKGNPRFKRMEVEASVSPAHRLYLRRVLVDGKAYP